jgi:putative ABC transport system ATP-binding protein
MEPLIRLQDVSKIYPMPGEDVHALDHLDLEIEPGEFLAIVGASGSGKTTLLYLLGLLAEPTSGHYLFDGRDVGTLSDRELSRLRGREIGFVFQAFHLLPQISVLDNVILATRYASNGSTAREVSQRAKTLLGRVGLGHRLGHHPRQLSGGEMQRVAIARALLGSPRLILADEPTGNLDHSNGQQIFHLLAELADEGKTVVLVTHQMDLAGGTRRIVKLKDGKVVDELRPALA